jgi:hypothetical protein
LSDDKNERRIFGEEKFTLTHTQYSTLQAGKVHLGYIFGYSVMGSGAMYLLLNLMTERGIGMYHCMSVLGYSLPPMILLALLSLVLPYR